MALDYPEILAKNELEDGTVSYDATEDDVYIAAHVADRGRLTKFVGEDTATQRITFVLTAAQEVDTFVFDKNFVITGGSANVALQWSTGNSPYSWNTFANITDFSDNTLPQWKTDTAVTKQYWSLYFTNLTAAPTVFNVWAGKRIALTTSPQGDFDPYNAESIDAELSNPYGVSHSVHRANKAILDAGFAGLTPTHMTDFESWWTDAGKLGLPWWWLFAPDAYAAAASSTTAPLYILSPGARRNFPFSRALRTGNLSGREV